MLDVGDLDDLRLARRLDPDRVRAQSADDSLGDDPLLAAVLVAAQQLLAEVVIDGGVELRRVEPARATVEALAPARRTSSSGLAPMKAASGVPQQKQKQAGNCSRIAPNSGAGSWAAAVVTTTSRASTTLLISSSAILNVAAPPSLRNRPGDERCGSRRGRSGAGRAAAAAPRAQAGETGDERGGARVRVVTGLHHGVDGEKGAPAAAAERKLRQDE